MEENRIVNIRKRTGLNQTDFAKKYNIPRRSVQNWEAAPDSANYRKCPDYVADLLERVVSIDFP